jgi:hypothetical protein
LRHVDGRFVEDREWVTVWAAEHIDITADSPAETPLRFHRDTVEVRESDRHPR